MADLVAFRANVAVTARGQYAEPGELLFLPERAPVVGLLGIAIERAADSDHLAPREER